MFDTICTLPLAADLFAQAVHPTAPLVAVGLSSGHVASLQLPPAGEEDHHAARPSGTSILRQRRGSNGDGVVETAWRTKRHKGSCRCLGFSLDGLHLYSAGTDGIVKAADTTTGHVVGKLAVPSPPSTTNSATTPDAPTVLHALTPQTLLLGTDAGSLHLYDLRVPHPTPATTNPTNQAFTHPTRPAATHHPHPDDLTSLTPLPASSTSTSGFPKQWLSTGGTTLALTDLRRGVLVQSEDQDDLLLSSCYLEGLPASKGSTAEKAIVGGSEGVLTVWERGAWTDSAARIHVSRGKETVDVLAVVPDGVAGGVGGRKTVAVGLGDGNVKFVGLGGRGVLGEVRHDELEGVVGLGFAGDGRMVSGGGQVVKVWQERIQGLGADDDDDDDEETDREDQDEDGEGSRVVSASKALARDASDEGDMDDSAASGSSSEEEQPKRRRKKRKRGKGPAPAANGLSFSGLD
ncbi:hypothetical protein B0A50_08716 [Salinomyces thailandicus]|uniref:WD repeat-containing protein JIP5 n=1 Tax=Salinomyces thailandicus TaxID=706561 RepID=A0A4U0TIV4_9PEZI|nr:hypothetical protein B0A50_08716 [Salinomyces thailandica]